MTAAHHRFRMFLIAVLFALLLLALFARRTSAGWSAVPVRVHVATALCPPVSEGDLDFRIALRRWLES